MRRGNSGSLSLGAFTQNLHKLEPGIVRSQDSYNSSVFPSVTFRASPGRRGNL